MKARILKRIHPSGSKSYTIQQRHFLFRWWWVDAWMNSSDIGITDTFCTLEEAEKNLCHFDGTKTIYEVIA